MGSIETEAAPGRLQELLKTIKEDTTVVTSYLKENDLPEPSFDQNGPVSLGIKSEEIDVTRARAAEAALELHDLLVGPAILARPWLNGGPLHAIYSWDMLSKVPLDGSISFRDLADQCGLHEVDVRRIIRYAIVWHRVFQEKSPGQVSHSAASKYLVDDSNALALLGLTTDELIQGYSQTVRSLKEFKNFERFGTGWSLGRGTDLDIWDYYGRHPERATRFGKAMAAYSKNPGQDPKYFVQGYDWEALGDSLIADCGGGNAHIAILLASKFPKLRFIVEDLPATIMGAVIPEDLADRVQTLSHDFFTTQPIAADVYLFRIVFHNWSDPLALKILRALVPALKSGARLLINDVVLPPPGVLPFTREKEMRAIDACMMTVQAAYEREEEDWCRLFREADSRWGNPSFVMPDGASNGIIEVIWKG